jgi:hypothetical protein
LFISVLAGSQVTGHLKRPIILEKLFPSVFLFIKWVNKGLLWFIAMHLIKGKYFRTLCLFCCSQDETILFLLSPEKGFLEPMTHEVFSTFIPSEGSSKEVEDIGEVFLLLV